MKTILIEKPSNTREVNGQVVQEVQILGKSPVKELVDHFERTSLVEDQVGGAPS